MLLENRPLRFFCAHDLTFFLADQRAKDIRSILSRDDLIQLEGEVTRILGAGIMEVCCDRNLTVHGRLSGRMKKYRIKVMVGDHVKVSVSPYDPSHGLITYRMK
jgi:translation initiation factor IF-1